MWQEIRTLSDTRLKPREVVLLNYFQGKDKAAKHPAWARDIATKKADGSIKWTSQSHPLLANVNEETLKSRLERDKDDGGFKLRLRSNGVSKEGGIPVEAHVKGKLEACLYPSGFTCPLEGGGMRCPGNGLMLAKEFAQHCHEKATGGKVVKQPPTAITVPQSHRAVYDAVCEAKPVGDPNLVYTKKIVVCPQHKTWADLVVHNVHDSQVFAHKCVPKDPKEKMHWMRTQDGEVLLAESPEHLGEIVQSARSDWADPWTNLYKHLGEWCRVQDHPLAKNLAAHGIVWKEPTVSAVREAIQAAMKKSAAGDQASSSKGAGGGGGGGKKALGAAFKGLGIGGKGKKTGK